jgi:predicted DNA-binding transcriptional regulator AlpA
MEIDRIIRPKVAAPTAGLSRSQMIRLEKENKFPQRVMLGPKIHGYLASEVAAWIAEMVAERDRGRSR